MSIELFLSILVLCQVSEDKISPKCVTHMVECMSSVSRQNEGFQLENCIETVDPNVFFKKDIKWTSITNGSVTTFHRAWKHNSHVAWTMRQSFVLLFRTNSSSSRVSSSLPTTSITMAQWWSSIPIVGAKPSQERSSTPRWSSSAISENYSIDLFPTVPHQSIGACTVVPTTQTWSQPTHPVARPNVTNVSKRSFSCV